MATDLLAATSWTCGATPAGSAAGPGDLAAVDWIPASVPGTAAGALRTAGRWSLDHGRDFDADDWWFRCAVPDVMVGGPCRLELDGIATIFDVWLGGEHLLSGRNMFRGSTVTIPSPAPGAELLIGCRSLATALSERRPRPRWKTRLIKNQNLRWFRTTLLGRIGTWDGTAAPVGPWRPVRLVPVSEPCVVDRDLVVRCDGDTGVVEVAARVVGVDPDAPARILVGRHADAARVRRDRESVVVEGSVRIPEARRWWPHTHGGPARYQLSLEIGGHELDLGRIGFRTVEVDRTGGGFQFVVNGVPVFCRGACWVPPDIVSLVADPAELRAMLELVREAGMNMLRITGTMTYEDDAFWDLCDELGILVWQDAMFARLDPPDDQSFLDEADAELTEVLRGLQGRPAIAVVCGGSEVQQQASMLGFEAERWRMPLVDDVLARVVEKQLPGLPYLPSSPTGGDLPFRSDAGVSHYFGVGAYVRPPDDARRAGVRFTSECLAFSVPPERATVDALFGGAEAAGHREDWKRGVPRDGGASWDFEDVRDFYVEGLFGVDPRRMRYEDPERALDVGRAVVAGLMAGALSEWRRPESPCAGALVYFLRDPLPGAGWGLLDAFGRPKAPWYALRRAQQPIALLSSDEGLNGLILHAVNDTAEAIDALITVDLFTRGEIHLEHGEAQIHVPAHSGHAVSAEALLGGFRDVTYAYRFGPPAHDVVAAALVVDDHLASELVHLPLGLARPIEGDLGLRAVARVVESEWVLDIDTRRFAQWVSLEVDGFRPDDSWFHLAPGATRRVLLHPAGAERPHGDVRALNALTPAPITVEPEPG
ncbi:MAG: putative glycosidase [Acidimicrobiales bacterium]|jgi:beta-mannosidase|nr:putative glycosidase [Acidimicrobiales bacterium]